MNKEEKVKVPKKWLPPNPSDFKAFSEWLQAHSRWQREVFLKTVSSPAITTSPLLDAARTASEITATNLAKTLQTIDIIKLQSIQPLINNYKDKSQEETLAEYKKSVTEILKLQKEMIKQIQKFNDFIQKMFLMISRLYQDGEITKDTLNKLDEFLREYYPSDHHISDSYY